MRTFARYLLFQIPELILLALLLWLLLDRNMISLWAARGLFFLWIIKDLAVYPLVRRAYEASTRTGTAQLIGTKGVAQEPLNPEGYVRINGELWKARTDPSNQPIGANTVVRVTAATGMTLIVQADDFPSQSRSTLPKEKADTE
jgi:membrane protein implicated in regulation of membrane protease activity